MVFPHLFYQEEDGDSAAHSFPATHDSATMRQMMNAAATGHSQMPAIWGAGPAGHTKAGSMVPTGAMMTSGSAGNSGLLFATRGAVSQGQQQLHPMHHQFSAAAAAAATQRAGGSYGETFLDSQQRASAAYADAHADSLLAVSTQARGGVAPSGGGPSQFHSELYQQQQEQSLHQQQAAAAMGMGMVGGQPTSAQTMATAFHRLGQQGGSGHSGVMMATGGPFHHQGSSPFNATTLGMSPFGNGSVSALQQQQQQQSQYQSLMGGMSGMGQGGISAATAAAMSMYETSATNPFGAGKGAQSAAHMSNLVNVYDQHGMEMVGGPAQMQYFLAGGGGGASTAGSTGPILMMQQQAQHQQQQVPYGQLAAYEMMAGTGANGVNTGMMRRGMMLGAGVGFPDELMTGDDQHRLPPQYSTLTTSAGRGNTAVHTMASASAAASGALGHSAFFQDTLRSPWLGTTAPSGLSGMLLRTNQTIAATNDAQERLQSIMVKRKEKKKRAKTFPEKLMQAMSEHADEDAVGWLPDGKSFVIVSPEAFVNQILNKVFKEAKYASFIRKLHRWGFVRLTSGTGTDCFHHPFFQKGRRDLTAKIVCSTREAGDQAIAPHKLSRNDKPPSLAGVERFIRAKAAVSSGKNRTGSKASGSKAKMSTSVTAEAEIPMVEPTKSADEVKDDDSENSSSPEDSTGDKSVEGDASVASTKEQEAIEQPTVNV